jgi:hypothetical protein
VIGPRDGQRRNRGWIPGKGKRFLSSLKCPDRLWDPPTLRFSAYRGESGRRVKLISQLHLGRRLKLSGSIPPLPHVSEWFADVLPFVFLVRLSLDTRHSGHQKRILFCRIISSVKTLTVPNGPTRFSFPFPSFYPPEEADDVFVTLWHKRIPRRWAVRKTLDKSIAICHR